MPEDPEFPTLDIDFSLIWSSETQKAGVRHADSLFAAGVDVSVDRLPEEMAAALRTCPVGGDVERPVSAAFFSGDAPADTIFDLPGDAFRGNPPGGAAITPSVGRYYPRRMISGLPDDPVGRTTPIRYLGRRDGRIAVDTRHPLADHALILSATVRDRRARPSRRQPIDWGARLADGPGMQACWRGRVTEFLSDDAFARPDEGRIPNSTRSLEWSLISTCARSGLWAICIGE